MLELYCSACRRPYREAARAQCVLGYHLIGGHPDQSRAPRKRRGGFIQPDGRLTSTA